MKPTDWRPITERKFDREEDFWVHPEDLDAFELHFLMQVDLPYNADKLRRVRFYKDADGRFYMAREPLNSASGFHHLMPIAGSEKNEGLAIIGTIVLLALGREMHQDKSDLHTVHLAKEMYPLISEKMLKELVALTDTKVMEALRHEPKEE